MRIWVWISKATGMPLAVQKCDFQPSVNHGQNPGEWVGFDRDEIDDLRTKLEKAESQLFALQGKGEICAICLRRSLDCKVVPSENWGNVHVCECCRERDSLKLENEKLELECDEFGVTIREFNLENQTLRNENGALRKVAEAAKTVEQYMTCREKLADPPPPGCTCCMCSLRESIAAWEAFNVRAPRAAGEDPSQLEENRSVDEGDPTARSTPRDRDSNKE